MRTALLMGLAALALASCSAQGNAQGSGDAPAAATDSGGTIAAAVADPGRPAADTARDADRKPAEIVAFAGVKPGDVVAELLPGGGYYTRILAKAVGPNGKVFAVVPPGFAKRPGAMDAINAIAKDYGNVTVVMSDLDKLELAQPVDLVWTTENYHDLFNGPTADPAGVDKAVFAALKPGGFYFIEDHSAPGAGKSVTSTLHRIDPATVKEQVEGVGFVLDASSDILANPEDAHDKAVFDPAIRGKTDKFALRFKKPE